MQWESSVIQLTQEMLFELRSFKNAQQERERSHQIDKSSIFAHEIEKQILK